MTEKEKVFQYLNRQKSQNFAAIAALSRHGIMQAEFFDEGLLAQAFDRNKGGGTFFIVHEKPSTLSHFLKKIGSGKEIVVTNYFENEWKDIGLSWNSVCYQFVYDNVTPFEKHETEGVTYCELFEKDFEKAHGIYTLGDAICLDEFSYDINTGFSVAAYEESGELIGFIGTHGDGSMGMLEVLPQYRRHHIGEELEKRLITKIIASQQTPFCHIIEGNEKSMNLQKKLGGTLCENKVAFLELL